MTNERGKPVEHLPEGVRRRGGELLRRRGVRRALRLLERHGSTIGVGALALGVGVGAVLVPGVRAADEQLDDQLVYVANGGASMVGTVNPQVTELAQVARVGGETNFELWQSGQDVLVHTNSNQLQVYTPATNTMGTPVNLPVGAQVSVNAGKAAITNPATGKVWLRAVTDLKDDLAQAQPSLDVGENGTAVVTASGQLVGLNVRESTLVRPGEGAGRQVSVPVGLKLSATSRDVQLSAVGDQAVVHDPNSQSVWTESGRSASLAGAGAARLAAPLPEVLGGDQRRALIGTDSGLAVVDGRGITRLAEVPEARGVPAQPVQVGECAYGAMTRSAGSSIGTVVKACRDREPVVMDVPLPQGVQTGEQPQLRFATNRGTVALNEVTSGQTWLVTEELTVVPQMWTRLVPPQENRTDQPARGTARVQKHATQLKPVAVDDRLGARAGRSTILDVLDNDSDPNGDVITVVDAPRAVGNGVLVQKVRGGAALQVTVPSNAKGSVSFPYTIGDGHPNGTASATVHLRIAPADPAAGNQAPEQVRGDRVLRVAAGGQASIRALLDWRDPEGDDLVLVNATTKDPDDEVSFNADGSITYANKGKGGKNKRVDLVVSDGVRQAKGQIKVAVTDKASAPEANADLYQLRIGGTLLATPLQNDEGDQLRLTKVGDPTLAGSARTPAPNTWTIVRKPVDNAFTFAATVAGTWYVPYTVASRSGASSQGVVRIDVSAKAQDNRPPVAARDVALMTGVGKVLIDPLANDADPDGDVMVVQSVQAQDPNAPVRLVLQQRQYVSVEAIRRIDRPLPLRYWVSDGNESVEGTIMVVPAKSSTGTAQPITEADELRVRAGTTASASVLANDHSPLGLGLRISRLANDGGGRAWIDGDRIRVATEPSSTGDSFPVVYEAKDDNGLVRAGVLTVNVTSSDGKNDPPTPQVVEARVLGGSTTRIRIPLDGIDPDGDPVRLVGLGGAPKKGRVTQVGDGYLTYEAFPGSRLTDSFKYRVMDAKGATGTGEVRVGIAPRMVENNAPTAVPDVVRVRPGRAVQLPVLANDFDVDGDAIGLSEIEPAKLPVDYRVVNSTDLSFTAPTAVGTQVGSYTVRDARGLSAQGAVSIDVDPAAPLAAPVARDDVVSPQAVAGKQWVAVKVLANDHDLDGRAADLRLSVPERSGAEGVQVLADRSLRVPVQQATRQFRYRLTDADGLWSEAVVTVPGRDDELPTLRETKPLVVTAGQLVKLDVNQLAVGTHGRRLTIASRADVQATTGVALTDGEGIQFTPDATGHGPAALVMQVREVAPAEARPAARSAWLSVPVHVKPAPGAGPKGKQRAAEINLAPQGTVPRLDVPLGESNYVDLALSFTDPEMEKFHFEQWRALEGDPAIKFRTNDAGNVVYGQASADAKLGLTRVIKGRVVDVSGMYREVRLTMTTVKSTKPLPVATTDVVDDADAGRSRSVDVLANDHSFVTPNTLSLVGAPEVTQGSGRAVVQGNKLVITPDVGFHGVMTVRYTIQDAVNDASRQVDGVVRATVRSVPDRPGTPTMVASGDRTATIAWTEPAGNGLPITGHTVVGIGSNGDRVESDDCTSSTCTIGGLTNDVAYRFTVVASNALGPSEPSLPSAPITPDVRPERPDAPRLDFADKALKVSWQPPTNKGSAISGYTLVLTSAEGSQQAKLGAVTSHTWQGLTNGTPYTVRVLATNKRGDSELSAASEPEHPTGPPGAPGKVTVRDPGGMAGGRAEVSWDAPADNGGDPIDGYDVYATSSSGRVRIADDLAPTPARNTLLWKGADNGTSYTFTVVAHNRAGDGAASPKSEPFLPYGAPGAPAAPTLVVGQNSITLTKVPVAKPKEQVVAYEFQLTRTGSQWTSETVRVPATADGSVNGVVFRDLEIGGGYVGRLVAIAQAGDGQPKASQPASTAPVAVWGQLPAPRISLGLAADGGRAPRIFRVVAVDPESRIGIRQVDYQYRVGTGGWAAVAPGDEVKVPTDGADVPIFTRAIDRDHALTSAEGESVLPPPFTIGQGTDRRIFFQLRAWPGGRQATCSLRGEGIRETLTVPLERRDGGGTFTWLPDTEPTEPTDPTVTPPPHPVQPDVEVQVSCSTTSITQNLPYTWKAN